MKIIILLSLVFAIGCQSESKPQAEGKAVAKAQMKGDQPNLDGLKEEDCDDEVDYKKPAEEVVVDLTKNDDEGCSLE